MDFASQLSEIAPELYASFAHRIPELPRRWEIPEWVAWNPWKEICIEIEAIDQLIITDSHPDWAFLCRYLLQGETLPTDMADKLPEVSEFFPYLTVLRATQNRKFLQTLVRESCNAVFQIASLTKPPLLSIEVQEGYYVTSADIWACISSSSKRQLATKHYLKKYLQHVELSSDIPKDWLAIYAELYSLLWCSPAGKEHLIQNAIIAAHDQKLSSQDITSSLGALSDLSIDTGILAHVHLNVTSFLKPTMSQIRFAVIADNVDAFSRMYNHIPHHDVATQRLILQFLRKRVFSFLELKKFPWNLAKALSALESTDTFTSIEGLELYLHMKPHEVSTFRQNAPMLALIIDVQSLHSGSFARLCCRYSVPIAIFVAIVWKLPALMSHLRFQRGPAFDRMQLLVNTLQALGVALAAVSYRHSEIPANSTTCAEYIES